MEPGQKLRQAIEDGAIQVPGAANALVARLIAQNGFAATYLSGAAFSAGTLGLPDIGLFTLSELAQHTSYLAKSVDIPLIVDADTGFGDTVNVERTVVELSAAGAAAIQLEDQQLPKRCGHLSGKSLIDGDAMQRKLRAAVTARGESSLLVIARTDARDSEGFEAAIDRAQRYVEAGADWIFPEALLNEDEFAEFARRVEVPLVANMTEFGKSPLIPFEDLAAMGYAAVLYPVTLMRVAMKAAEAVLQHLLVDGSQSEVLDLMQTRHELYELLGYDDFEHRDRSYFGEHPS